MTSSEKETLYFAAVKSSLKMFVWHAFISLNERTTFMDNWHIDAIVNALELAIQGRQPRLIINMPPRHLKSFVISVALPAFILGHDPTAKIVCVSYSDRLAKELSQQFRRIVASAWYRKLFPDVREIKNADNEFATDLGGKRYTTSVGGSLTGLGGDFILIDDPIKPDDIHSDSLRNSVNEWFRDVVQTRLDDPELGVLILVMQRLHVNDLTGYMESMGRFHKLSLPAIATQDQRIAIGNERFHLRLEGDLLHAERMGAETLTELRHSLGPANFNAQYQQNPDSPDGEIFKKTWIKYVSEIPDAPEGIWTLSVDTALAVSKTSHYTAITVAYSDRSGHYIRHVTSGRWDYDQLVSIVSKIIRALNHDFYFIVEAAGVGHSLALALLHAGKKCFHYFPKDGKIARAYAVQAMISAGRLHIYRNPDESKNGWNKPYVDELLMFPNGRFDDQVDSLVQMLLWAERRVNPGGDYISKHLARGFSEVRL